MLHCVGEVQPDFDTDTDTDTERVTLAHDGQCSQPQSDACRLPGIRARNFIIINHYDFYKKSIKQHHLRKADITSLLQRCSSTGNSTCAMSSEGVRSEFEALQQVPFHFLSQGSPSNIERVESSSSTPPSSPPVAKEDASREEVPSATRKRSYERMTSEPEDALQSSMTVVGDVGSSLAQASSSNITSAKQTSHHYYKDAARPPSALPCAGDAHHCRTDASSTLKPSSIAHTMLPPPPPPASSKQGRSQKPPVSVQGSVNAQDAQSQTAQSANATQGSERRQATRSSTSETMSNESDSSGSFDLGDPEDRIEDFDWDGLHQRYHAKMGGIAETEQGIMDEFGRLCDVCYCTRIRVLSLTCV